MGVLVLLSLFSCASSSVKRVKNTKTTDYSGYWNDKDVNLAAKEIIKEFSKSKAIKDYPKSHKKNNPVVIVGSFRNLSDEHIDTGILVDRLQAEVYNSGYVDFVASKEQRSEVREERDDQQENASASTKKALKNETGADFMLQGTIRTIVDTEINGEKTARTYYINTQLIDIETNQILWKNENHSIKKIITRKSKRR